MRFSTILFFTLAFVSCNTKPSDNTADENYTQETNGEIVYDLQGGYKAFIQDTIKHQDSLAREQALYLAQTYGDDGITQYANGIKKWLNDRGIKYDSVYKKAIADLDKKDEERKQMEANSLHNGLTGNTDDAYDKIHIAFEGMPDIEKVKPMLDAVMERYNITINNDNVLKCANVLVVMKQDSKVGVTEMDILKHMYQRGSSSVDYATQAAISATYLEQNK